MSDGQVANRGIVCAECCLMLRQVICTNGLWHGGMVQIHPCFWQRVVTLCKASPTKGANHQVVPNRQLISSQCYWLHWPSIRCETLNFPLGWREGVTQDDKPLVFWNNTTWPATPRDPVTDIGIHSALASAMKRALWLLPLLAAWRLAAPSEPCFTIFCLFQVGCNHRFWVSPRVWAFYTVDTFNKLMNMIPQNGQHGRHVPNQLGIIGYWNHSRIKGMVQTTMKPVKPIIPHPRLVFICNYKIWV